MSNHASRLLADIEHDSAYAAPLLRVRAARETAALLRDLRKRAGLTQQAIAAKLGVSQARISQVESGVLDHLPPLDFIYLFTDACGARLTLNAKDKDAVLDTAAAETVSSEHIETYHVAAHDTEFGPERITREIPGASEESLENLDVSGVVKIGTHVRPGDILVGKITPTDGLMTPEEKLLRAIFGEKVWDVRDTSLRMPPSMSGTVVNVHDTRLSENSISVDIAIEKASPGAVSRVARVRKNAGREAIPGSGDTHDRLPATTTAAPAVTAATPAAKAAEPSPKARQAFRQHD